MPPTADLLVFVLAIPAAAREAALRLVRWWKHLRRWNWKDIRRHLTGPQGRWRGPTADGIELFNIAAVPVTR